MVAELQAEIEGLKARLQAAEDELDKNNKEKTELQEEVEANHQAYFTKISKVDDKLRDIETAKQEMLDVMGPKFAELRNTAEAIINDSKKKCDEQGNQIGSLMKEAGGKFTENDEKQTTLNQKLDILFELSKARRTTGVHRQSKRRRKRGPQENWIAPRQDDDPQVLRPRHTAVEQVEGQRHEVL